MGTGKKYTNAVEDRLILDKFSLDMYGDDLIRMGFRYIPVGSPFEIVKVSEKYESKCFEGNFSVN